MARLLVVDDEPSLCQMLEIAFRKDGHTVETVSSGQAALKKIDTHAHDLIISDIRMPDLSGIDLLKHARATGSPAAFILKVDAARSEEHTSELQSRFDLVCRLLLEKKKEIIPAPLPP